jgi:hypothetical protein
VKVTYYTVLDVCEISVNGLSAFTETCLLEVIDDNLSYYHRNHVEGYIIKHFKQNLMLILDRLPGFKVDMYEGRIRIDYYIMALMWLTNPEKYDYYWDYRERLKGQIIEIQC